MMPEGFKLWRNLPHPREEEREALFGEKTLLDRMKEFLFLSLSLKPLRSNDSQCNPKQ